MYKNPNGNSGFTELVNEIPEEWCSLDEEDISQYEEAHQIWLQELNDTIASGDQVKIDQVLEEGK